MDQRMTGDRGCDCSHFHIGRAGHYKRVFATRSNDLLLTHVSVLSWEARSTKVRHGLRVPAAEREAALLECVLCEIAWYDMLHKAARLLQGSYRPLR